MIWRWAGAVAALLVAFAASGIRAPVLSYRTSWIGNTYGGRDHKWVQDWVQGMYVAPDGTVYTNAFWDEGGREVGIYRNGRVIDSAGHTHGWGYTGGSAIAANGKYLFIAQSVNTEGGHLQDPDTWPQKGKLWFGVSRRLLSDPKHGAPFPGGKGGKGDTLKGSFLVVNEAAEGADAPVAGLAATDSRLFVSDPANRRIRVYDPESMTLLRDWSVDRPGQIALAPDRTLWTVQSGQGPIPPRILHFSLDGRSLADSIRLPGRVRPTAVCVDPRGRILVADDGPDQNVKIYHPNAGGTRSQLGVRGGVIAGPVPGRVGPLRFHDLSGVGVDGAGNVYVSSGYGAAGDGVGTELECCSPQGKRLWQLLGLLFVDESETDPLDDTQAYAKHEHFGLDYAKMRPGTEWSYRGFTLDRLKYPQDPRLHVYPTTVWVRRIQGRRILYMVDMYSTFLAIYRFSPSTDGEIAIPCGYFAKERHKPDRGKTEWPPNQPDQGEWIWRDRNANGAFDAGEFESRPQNAPDLWGWWVDERGDVWQATEHNGIRRFPLQGMDSRGSPVYSYGAMQITATPPLFNNLQRAQYDPGADTLYLAGYTKSYPNDHGYWKVTGRVIACYPNWSKGNRTPAWDRTVSFEDARGETQIPASFTVAGDFLFTVEVLDAGAKVYDRRTGEPVGEMRPGPEVGSASGWVDVPYGISAHRRADGEYIILVEEDAFAKNTLYRWRPPVR